jgi:Ca2+ transporting ATPase
VIAIFFCQLFIIQVGGRAFKLVPLSFNHHLQCIVIGSTMLVYAYIVKWIVPESFLNNFDLLREDAVV